MSNYNGSRKAVCLDYNRNEDITFQTNRRRVTTLTKTVSIPNIVVRMNQASPVYKQNINIQKSPPKKRVEFEDLSKSQLRRMPDTNHGAQMSAGNSRARQPLRLPRPLHNMAELRLKKIANAKEVARRDLFAACHLPLPPSPTTSAPLLAQQLEKLQLRSVEEELRECRTPETRREWQAAVASFERFRPKFTDFKPTPGRCCCNRPAMLIMCRGCGFHTKGNLKYTCSAHPTVVYLSHFSGCPQCKAPNLLTESPLLN